MMISDVVEVVVYGFAIVGFGIVACLALGATMVAADSELRERREEAKWDAVKSARRLEELEVALRQAQPKRIVLPAMMEE